MARHLHKNRFKNIDNTGFGPNSSIEGNRLTNKDGSTNLRKTGLPFWERISVYHSLLRMKRSSFLFFVLLIYTSVNIFFALIYYAIGVDHLIGMDGEQTQVEKFMDAFFFSSQTLTTVGYGHIAPSGMAMNITASIESLIGILIFALVTGLIYGRFARPRAYLIFSDNLLVAPYKNDRALMLRIASYKNNHLTDVEAVMTLALHIQENGKTLTRFYPLNLEFKRVNSLALSWTLVHPMDEESPLFSYSKEDIEDSKMELIVAIKGFDDHFSNIVQQRTSYTYKEVVYGAKFLPMFNRATSGTHTVLELDKINAYELAKLPDLLPDIPESLQTNA